ncbi:glycosyltransferase family 4 protein [Candidatus Pacearchaeota archaeon]|nr:glycosyltransferase family 4 protein [Candidatus Pacearchaeota archaeon]
MVTTNNSDEPPSINEEKEKKSSDKRRICILTFFYKPTGGGIPRYVDNISKTFSKEGHKVDIITASYNGKKIEREGNITIYRLPYMTISRDSKINRENSKKFLGFLKKYAKKKPDIFVAQNFHSVLNIVGHPLALNMIAIEKNIPVVLTIHAFIKEDENKLMKISLIKNLFWDKIIAMGSNLAESLFNAGIPSESICISIPPVNTEVFKPRLGKKWLRTRIDVSNKDFLLVHASRTDTQKITEEKGIFTTLKALSQINDKNVKLLIATAPTAPPFQESKDESIERIKETSKLLGIEKRVFIETFNAEDMPLVYNGADLCVLASEYENCSLSVSEAMACEIPTLTTNVGGLPNIVEAGKSGEMINMEDPVEMAKEIREFIKNKPKLKKAGKHGRKTVIKKQEIEKISKNLLGMYESVILKNNNKN